MGNHLKNSTSLEIFRALSLVSATLEIESATQYINEKTDRIKLRVRKVLNCEKHLKRGVILSQSIVRYSGQFFPSLHCPPSFTAEDLRQIFVHY